jgi:hypothetical protein
MRKQILSLAVAVLIGLVSSQAIGLPAGGLPGYATYQGQAAMNNKVASQFGINTTELNAMNGGFGGAANWSPENFLSQVTGGTGGMIGLPKAGAVSLLAVGEAPVAATPAVDPVLAAKMAQLQADFEMRQMAME